MTLVVRRKWTVVADLHGKMVAIRSPRGTVFDCRVTGGGFVARRHIDRGVLE